MKYTLIINQKQALELGMKNVNQVIILGLIADAHSWAEPEIIDNVVYYWTARQKISEELPLLKLQSDSVYRHLKTLSDLGLIDYKKVGKKDCVRLTKKGKSYYVGNKSELDVNSEINPSKFGNKSENNSEINPTYKNTNLIRATRDNNKKEIKKVSYELSNSPFNFSLSKDIHYTKLTEEYKLHLKEEILKLKGLLPYQDFVDALEATSKYKYMNFLLAYKNWNRKQQQPNKQTFKQQETQATDHSIDTFLNAREQGFDLRNTGNEAIEDVEVLQ